MGVAALVERLRPQLSRQFTGDVAWNLAAFAVMGVAGLLLNFLIAKLYDAATLGVFNQVYAVYILLSQVAVAGIHLSVLKHVSVDAPLASDILSGGVVATLLVAAPVTVFGYFGGPLVGRVLESPDVARGVQVAMLGVLFFAINKVLLALHNGLSRLRPFAVFQATRFVLMVGCMVLLAALKAPGRDLPFLFTLAEGGLLVVLVAYTIVHHRPTLSAAARAWVGRHLAFGYRALWGNLLADVNTRVDILILGFYVSDRIVGIYSFAALIAEGFSQLAVVFRNVVNPRLAQQHAAGEVAEFENKLRKGVRLAYTFATPLGVALMVAYPLAVRVLGVGNEYLQGWPAFAVLMTGVTLSMGYSALQMMLNQGGHPGEQSLFFALVFATNAALNFILIPLLGMMGSAIATAVSFIASIAFLRTLVRRAMGVRI